ncbi:ribonuclease H-like domain-containing protein, partial [Tanacetum coccineum]
MALSFNAFLLVCACAMRIAKHFVGYATRVGFQQSKTDSSLFIYHRGFDIAYLLLYVDDIILTASSPAFLQRVIASLHYEFVMTNLGSLNYFLGISAHRSSTSLFLSQSTYAAKNLERAHMKKCNPCRTLVDTYFKLGTDGDPVIQQVCLYMHDLREPHLNSLKRILRYARGTIDHGLQLHESSTSHLTAYTHVGWLVALFVIWLKLNTEVLLMWLQTIWVRNLLCGLHAPLFTATLVYCDN